MGYALKLNRVNFSNVAVGQIEYIEEKPCTGLSLDQNSLSFESVGETKTLTATKVPSDTTDELTWTSSNNNIATVVNGVVTIHGIGNAVITATCGQRTASATINQTSIKPPYACKMLTGVSPGGVNTEYGERILVVSANNNQYSFGQAYHAENRNLRVLSGDYYDIECVAVPYGATKVKIKTVNDQSVSISYTYVVDMNDLVKYSAASDVVYPKFLREQTFVKTDTGYAVEYGEAVIFRPYGASQADPLEYIYFE